VPTLDVLGQPIREGKVLFHEHVQFAWPGFHLDYRARRTNPAEAIAKLNEVADLGYAALVDATPIECGRDLGLLAEIARASRLQIVASVGIYHAGRGFPTHLSSLSIDEFADLFRHDLAPEPGQPHAGTLKVAVESVPFSKRETKAAEAAAMVSREDGTPIITHTTGVPVARELLAIFERVGANPERIVLGHLDGVAPTVDELVDLTRHGVFVGIDHVGTGGPEADERRLAMLAALREAGVLSSVLISHDRPITFLGRITTGYEGINPYVHIDTTFVPQLRARGFSDEDIDTLLIANPRRFLGI
jgi:phosphotriesterase-related protein